MELLNYIDIPVSDIHGKQNSRRGEQPHFLSFASRSRYFVVHRCCWKLDIPDVDWIIQCVHQMIRKVYSQVDELLENRRKRHSVILIQGTRILKYLKNAKVL